MKRCFANEDTAIRAADAWAFSCRRVSSERTRTLVCKIDTCVTSKRAPTSNGSCTSPGLSVCLPLDHARSVARPATTGL